MTVEDAAKEYESEMMKRLPSMSLDLALCGMGPDGHTCSLFPGHPLLDEKTALIAPITDSPKPPPSRITMTFPLLAKSRTIVFVVTGKKEKFVIHSRLLTPLPHLINDF